MPEQEIPPGKDSSAPRPPSAAKEKSTNDEFESFWKTFIANIRPVKNDRERGHSILPARFPIPRFGDRAPIE